MNAQIRVILIVLWLVSMAGAYLAGGYSSPFGRAKTATASTAPRPSSGPDLGGTGLRSKLGGEPTPTGAESTSALTGAKTHDVGAVIAAVRKAMGDGRSGSFWGGSMFRMLAPLMELSPEEAQAALGEVGRTIEDPRQKSMLQSILLGRMAETDPKTALAEAEKLVSAGDSSGRGEGLYFSVVGALASKDPEAAWKWYSEKRDSGSFTEDGTRLSGMIFSGMAAKNLDQALTRMGDLTDFDERNMAASGIASAAKDPSTWQRILDSTESFQGDSGKEARSAMIRQWASTNFEATTALLAALPASKSADLLDVAGSGLVRSNPEKGAEFLLKDAPAAKLPERYTTIMNTWGDRDPNAAGAWLNKQPSSPAQDSARSNFARTVARRDPESALAWAKTVTESKQRTDAIRDVYRQWSRRDSASADAALASTGLSAQQVEEIRKAAQQQGPQFGRGPDRFGPPRF